MRKVPRNAKVMFCDNLGLFGYTFVELVKLTIDVETNSVFDILRRLVTFSICWTLFIVRVTS